jgi:prolyl-tRNA synthetase
MKDAYSFDYTDAGLDASYQLHGDAYERIFQRLGLEYVIVASRQRAHGRSRAARSSCTPLAIGEDTFVRSAGGYAAKRRGIHDRGARARSRSTANPTP